MIDINDIGIIKFNSVSVEPQLKLIPLPVVNASAIMKFVKLDGIR